MSVLTLPSESLDERIDKLVGFHSEAWPPMYSLSTHAAIGEIIGRVGALEAAVHEMALVIQTLAAELESLEASRMDD